MQQMLKDLVELDRTGVGFIKDIPTYEVDKIEFSLRDAPIVNLVHDWQGRRGILLTEGGRSYFLIPAISELPIQHLRFGNQQEWKSHQYPGRSLTTLNPLVGILVFKDDGSTEMTQDRKIWWNAHPTITGKPAYIKA